MKVLVFVKATPMSEKGIVIDDKFKQMFADMGKFNDQLIKAGIMQEADGLKPSSAGKRVVFSGDHVSVIDGPFVESKELVAGYWVWNVKSMDEALEWAKRCPNPMPGEEGVLELRPTNTMDDFAGLISDEDKAKYAQMEKEMARKKKAKAAPKSKAKPKAKAKAKAKKKPTRAKAKK